MRTRHTERCCKTGSLTLATLADSVPENTTSTQKHTTYLADGLHKAESALTIGHGVEWQPVVSHVVGKNESALVGGRFISAPLDCEIAISLHAVHQLTQIATAEMPAA
jgi:hypothetical protein